MAKHDREDRLFFNGINGATGEYGVPPMSDEELAHFLTQAAPPENQRELRHLSQRSGRRMLRAIEGVDPTRLDEAGWGVIFARNTDPEIREALEPLLDLRHSQAQDRFRVYAGDGGYLPGESKASFLGRHGAGPGPADPKVVPYYLLLVGGPEAIPFRFQSQLDVQYAVGRIHFETAVEYAIYAATVVASESGELELDRRATFFAPRNADDPATRASVRDLVEPLARTVGEKHPAWRISRAAGDEATKSRLSEMLGGPKTPALLFTASHGLELPATDTRQLQHQGALLCQDWPGPKAWHGAIPQDHYFAADDLTSDARLAGLISFHFACFGAGTPPRDESSQALIDERLGTLARHPFLASLPQRLLSHPAGGALAVIGQIDRAWGYSFAWQDAGPQRAVFESTLERLLQGHPVGSALEYFNQRYAELSTMLADHLQELEFGSRANPRELAGLWTANNDARGYVVLGDPAVRLNTSEPERGPRERPVIRPIARWRGRGEDPPPPPARQGKQGLGLPETPSGPSTAGSEAPPPGPDQSAISFGAQAPEEVHFSAYHPESMQVKETYPLLVYAHLQGMLDAISTDAGEVLGMVAADYHQAEADTGATIRPGTEITIVPQADGVTFEPASTKLTWTGAFQRADFQMNALPLAAGHTIEGVVTCYVGPLLIADIALPLQVAKDGEAILPEGAVPGTAPRKVQSAAMYKAIFASYSHADHKIVEAMEFAYKAVGMDYLRDVLTLKSGQNWSERLLEMIEEADVFQLFWSEKSRRSEYVEREWLHALDISDRKSPTFIRPIYWQRPLPTVPPQLYHLHFDQVEPPETIRAAIVDEPSHETATIEQVARDRGDDTPAQQPPAPLLPQAAQDLATLTVSTHTASDPAEPETAELRAQTRVSLTGDVDVYLPENAEASEVLDVHKTALREAVKARIAYLELLAGKPGR